VSPWFNVFIGFFTAEVAESAENLNPQVGWLGHPAHDLLWLGRLAYMYFPSPARQQGGLGYHGASDHRERVLAVYHELMWLCHLGHLAHVFFLAPGVNRGFLFAFSLSIIHYPLSIINCPLSIDFP
jgi:hypothetical protein